MSLTLSFLQCEFIDYVPNKITGQQVSNAVFSFQVNIFCIHI